ncbi:Long-chain-fatty-acid--CoA ligase 2 [Spathaspora sp. JA1]|nr:Long-chain-fatty-acid--CoA ligase 2 [Spathaspora sp. JA1]
MSLPSLADKDSVYASDDKPYVFENPNDLPLETLVNHILPFPQEYSSRSVKIPGTDEPGYTEIYRNSACPGGIKSMLVPGMDTYAKVFNSTAKRLPQRPAFGVHEYDYENDQHLERYKIIPYGEAQQRKKNLASGLMFLLESNPFKNLELESHRKIDNHKRDYQTYNSDDMSFVVAMYSGNRVEWVLTDLACSANSITSTALYDTLGPKASQYILETTECPVIVSAKEHIRSLIGLKEQDPEKLASLILIVSMDPLFRKDAELIKYAEKNNIKLFSFDQVERTGAIFPRSEYEPNPDTVFTISFTSGTTGSNPKGVLLPQKSALCAILAYSLQVPHHKDSKEFCFLPLAHIFERCMLSSVFFFGGSTGFPRLGGTPLTLFEDLKLWKPTFMANVPRIFTKLEAGIKATTTDSSSPLTRSLYNSIIETKITRMQSKDGHKGEHYFYDKLFIQKLRSLIGFDNIEFVFTGSAPISPDSIEFLKASLGMGMTQGYGLTESFGGVSMSQPYEAKVGTCGAISPSAECRLREIPEMGYMKSDKGGARGELQLRGPQIFTKYYKNPEETQKALSEDGWFSTGDVAQITEDGKLKIIDRVKNFFKLSQGEYVTPEKVENVYLSGNSILTQCYAHGDPIQSFLVGIVGVDPVNIVEYLKKQCSVQLEDLSTPEKILATCNKSEIKTRILLNLNSNLNGRLNGYERLHNIYIEFEPLRLDRQVVTPTQKLRRPIAAKFFRKQIDDMYEEGSIVKQPRL